MQAVIYCGGYGSRLKTKTKNIPKPIIKINKVPFLNYIINNLIRFGVNDIILLSYYKNEKILNYLKKSNFGKVKIKVIKEKTKLGTAGSLLNAKKYLKKNFFLLNGDTFFNFNILDLKKQFYLKKNIYFVMALSKNSNKRFKSISINKKNKLLNNLNRRPNLFINAGFYFVSKKVLKFIEKSNFSLESEIFPKLINSKKIIGIDFTNKRNFFIDIGVPRDLKKAEKVLKIIHDKKTVFLDRDGVINYDYGYVHSTKNFKWKKNIIKFIKFLNDKDYNVIVISNQSGVGRGYYSINKVYKLHRWINSKLILQGAHIDEFYIACYFKESKFFSSKREFNRRKPNIGMIKEAQKKWNIDLKKSLLIGDKTIDIDTAINAKIRNYIHFKKNNILSCLNHNFFKKDK